FVLTYSDITTGEIYSEILENNTDDIVYKLLSLEIKEVITNSSIDKNLLAKIKSQKIPVTISDNVLENDYNNIYQDLSDNRVILSIKMLLYYLSVTQKRNLSHFQKVMIKKKESFLTMDIHTKRNLEL